MNAICIFNNGSWVKPLNWNLEASRYGEPRAPFASYVQPDATDCSAPSGNFPGFAILPAELQLHIVSFCDARTLFQLMHVSSATRAEAKKLFWSLPDTWYHTNGSWLRGGGIRSHVFHTTEIQAYVQQVEVESFNIRSFYDEQKIHTFWQMLQHQFPSATRVVISEQWPRGPRNIPEPEFQHIMRLCPPQITVYASMVRKAPGFHKKIERSLWRRARVCNTAEGNWELVTPLWTRQSILLPPRKFSGPVGAFANAQYQSQRYRRRNYATRMLLIEAVESHHFDGRCSPFDCFELGCTAQFQYRGEWTLHAVKTGHDKYLLHPDKAMQTLRDEKRKIVDQLLQDSNKIWNEINEYWGEKESQKRQNAEQAFLHQLDNDPLYSYGKQGRENAIWESMECYLNVLDGIE